MIEIFFRGYVKLINIYLLKNLIMTKPILVHLSLGSNLGNKLSFLNEACNELESELLKDFRVSTIFESKPLLKMKQPNYFNIVVCGLTNLSPFELLNKCHFIEDRLGRVRSKKWDSRTIDLDILSYGNEIIDTEILKIPHPEIENRNFVLIPLLELSPNWIHPVLGIDIKMLCERLQNINGEDLPKPLKQKINSTYHMLV